MAVIARFTSALTDTPRLKTVHRTVFLTAVSITFHSKNKRAPQGYSFIFGGDGGNRNRVQNWLTKGSTSVVYRLSYPLTYRRQTAYTLRYPLIPDESRGALPFMFATKSTLCPKPWHSLGERKLLITQRELLIYCCQLILKCYFYRGATPLLADQGSPNLSKSFHPHILLFQIMVIRSLIVTADIACPCKDDIILVFFIIINCIAVCNSFMN